MKVEKSDMHSFWCFQIQDQKIKDKALHYQGKVY